MTDVRRVSPEEAHELMTREGYQYLDVRTEAEFAAGHPKGAHNIPFMLAGAGGMTKNPEFAAVVKAVYPTDARLVVGCKSGGRSLKAAAEMTSLGFTNLVDQRAGFDGSRNNFGQLVEAGWSEKGLPSETSTPGGSYAEVKVKKP
jgi:rhodanese-related sulfurtransferase